MKTRLANLEHSDENIADQYPDIFDGLQKDATQNANDAKKTVKYSGWKVLFKYVKQDNALIIEDFGTKGMDEKNWNKFWQGPWHTEKKGTTDAGQRGQGRYLFHYFSEKKTILAETMDEDGNYRFGMGMPHEYDDDNMRLEDYFPQAPRLDHQGTRIWILDVKKDFQKKLIDHEEFSSNVSASWWEIMRNYSAQFVLDFDGKELLVEQPVFPPIKKDREYENALLKDFGKVRNFVINYCEDDVPEKFRGIAVQRAGMTICRVPVRAEESISKKIYGYINFDQELEQNLKACELPNHMDFQYKRAWAHVKEYITNRIESFVLDISPKQPRVDEHKDILQEAAKMLNNLVREFAPELLEGDISPGGKSGGGNGGSGKPRGKDPIRIGSFLPESRKIEYGEFQKIACHLVNETQKAQNVSLLLNVHHEDGDKKYSVKYEFQLTPQSTHKVDIPLLDFERKIDKSGKYIAEAILKDDRKSEIDKRSFSFFVDTDPPEGKSFIKAFRQGYGKGRFFEHWKNLPLNDQGELYVIWDHPEFTRIRESVSSKKQLGKEILLYCMKCGTEEVMEKLLNKRLVDGQLTTEEMRNIKTTFYELIYATNNAVFSD